MESGCRVNLAQFSYRFAGEEAQTSSTQFWAIEENGHTTRFGSQMTAWCDEEYISLLGNAALTVLQRPDSDPTHIMWTQP